MALQHFGRRFGNGSVLAHQLGVGRAEGGIGSGRARAIEASGIKAGDQQQAGGVGVEAEQGGGIGLEGGDDLPALDGFAVITLGCAAFGFGDQQRQMGLDATGEAVIQGGLQVVHGWIGLIRRQEGTAEV